MSVHPAIPDAAGGLALQNPTAPPPSDRGRVQRCCYGGRSSSGFRSCAANYRVCETGVPVHADRSLPGLRDAIGQASAAGRGRREFANTATTGSRRREVATMAASGSRPRGCEHRRRVNLRRRLRDSNIMRHRIPHTRVARAHDCGIRCPIRSQCRTRTRNMQRLRTWQRLRPWHRTQMS
jgi:hypothetical protein